MMAVEITGNNIKLFYNCVVLQFVLPFVTIILCYTAIIKKLSQRSAQRPGK